jgi:peptidoglycan hydrolase CwlO-like protein
MTRHNTLLRIFLTLTIALSVCGAGVFSFRHQVRADDTCTCPDGQDELTCNKTKQACWTDKINQKKDVANTLSNTISVLNGQIVVQELQVKQTKLEIDQLNAEIQGLETRISGLNTSLDQLSAVLIQRVQASYKSRRTNPLDILLASDSLSNFFRKYKYLQYTQRHTSTVMKEAEDQKTSFDQEKALKEQKQIEVDKKKQMLQKQEADLAAQRAGEQTLLQQTQNDEARYQAELAKTLAEGQALSSIVAGQGSEEKVRDVNEGDVIASIIPGPSTCSNGAHLHFEVVRGGDNFNPANYLKPLDGIIWNNQPDDPFGFSGDWQWPINNAARINQGYGMTWYARVRRAYGGAPHTGIDMISKTSGDYAVKAVKSGTLYRGSIHCGNSLLRYVKVQHKDSDVSSYYLHVNY